MIDLGTLLAGAARTVPCGPGVEWTLHPPTAWDRLTLEHHLTGLADAGTVPVDAWRDVERIVLNGRRDDAAKVMPDGTLGALVWWAWIYWCRGEPAADAWVSRLGGALAATPGQGKPPPEGGASTSTGGVSANETPLPASTTPTGSHLTSSVGSRPPKARRGAASSPTSTT